MIKEILVWKDYYIVIILYIIEKYKNSIQNMGNESIENRWNMVKENLISSASKYKGYEKIVHRKKWL